MDRLDRAIIDLLRHDARAPVSEIGRRVGLSSAATGRRIARLESSGVIQGYVTLVNDDDVGGLDAFAELRLSGETSGDSMQHIAHRVPEITQYYVMAGDPDVLVRFQVANVGHLHTVVNTLRRMENVTDTKTLMILAAWDRRTNDPSPQGDA
ncbi:Lrp/AsnC family transcriptional regulator [Nocardioides carbamazepini]|uniref:Lrp/AsnC family transcriptional regulator n=1 Tax=Nocardioides carbamazepini TaxID=2854259 RepID=UPI00214A1247|nr:Lrp/AsnC family transcriptional regulator [Nocardioides carbamazepini]MCR1783809.1 Lrp/AsnC family transcriptional regulator [Nocardioides carbamazepini]